MNYFSNQKIFKYPKKNVFELIKNFEKYPEIFSYIQKCTLIECQDNNIFKAKVVITSHKIMNFSYNCIIKVYNESLISITSHDKIFKKFTVTWSFMTLTPESCLVKNNFVCIINNFALNLAFKVSFQNYINNTIQELDNFLAKKY